MQSLAGTHKEGTLSLPLKGIGNPKAPYTRCEHRLLTDLAEGGAASVAAFVSTVVVVVVSARDPLLLFVSDEED